MIEYLRRLARRILAVLAFLLGALLAAAMAGVALITVAIVGVALTLSRLLGRRANSARPAASGNDPAQVIDVEMREIDADAKPPEDRSNERPPPPSGGA